MKRIVEFPVESGNSIFVEVEDAGVIKGAERAGRLDTIKVKAQQTFQSAIDKIRPVAEEIVDRLSGLSMPADEIKVEFGIKMNSEVGAVLASAGGEVNYRISLSWKHKQEH